MLRFESSITDFNENGIWKVIIVPPDIVQALGAKTR